MLLLLIALSVTVSKGEDRTKVKIPKSGELVFVFMRMAHVEVDYTESQNDDKAEIESIRKKEEDLHLEVLILQTALSAIAPRGKYYAKVKIDEPKAYGGAMSAKDLKIFLWNI